MTPISHKNATVCVKQALPLIAHSYGSRIERFVGNTGIIATPAETFRHAGYIPELIVPEDKLPDLTRQRSQLRGMYQPLFLLTYVQDNLNRIIAEYPLRHNNKAMAVKARDQLRNYFSYVLSGPSMKVFEKQLAQAEQELSNASSPEQRARATEARDNAIEQRERALGYFDDIDEVQANVFSDFDTARFSTMNLNYKRFPTSADCRLYSEVLALASETLIAYNFTVTNLGIHADPQHEALYRTLRQWARFLLGDRQPLEEENTLWNNIYKAYILKLNNYVR